MHCRLSLFYLPSLLQINTFCARLRCSWSVKLEYTTCWTVSTVKTSMHSRFDKSERTALLWKIFELCIAYYVNRTTVISHAYIQRYFYLNPRSNIYLYQINYRLAVGGSRNPCAISIGLWNQHSENWWSFGRCNLLFLDEGCVKNIPYIRRKKK